MPEPIQELKKDGAPVNDEGSKRSEERFQDLVGKLKSETESKAVLLKELAETKFSLGWEKLVAKYPKAQEHFEEIKAESLAGKPVEDAAVVILHKNNKLMTAEQINTQEKVNDAGGGSADTKVTPPRNSAEVMRDPASSHEDRVAILRDLEAKGELGLKT